MKIKKCLRFTLVTPNHFSAIIANDVAPMITHLWWEYSAERCNGYTRTPRFWATYTSNVTFWHHTHTDLHRHAR